MSEPFLQGSSFESMLRREVDRVLADPSFQRSPVQARLLEYLCEQTVARNRHISQMAVAVDGLGRPENPDQLTESYPRVQISRLRRNLSLYYARCAPGEGLALYIGHGDYQLRLAPPDRAYSAERQRLRYPPPANDPAPASAIAAAPSADPGTDRAPADGRRRNALLLLAAAIVTGMLAVAVLWMRAPAPQAPAATVPSLAIRIDGESDPLLVLASQHAEDIAANSYVVRAHSPGQGAADYVLQLHRTESMVARPVLDLSLLDASGERLFHDSIPVGAERTAILARLEGALVHIASPAGIIARRELAKIGDEPGNDYECVLRTEADRLQGSLSTDSVEACLERFPQSGYRAYWLTRIAFMGYRSQVLTGGSVSASGEPWRVLQEAFAADSANPFTNYVAAKVSFARGDCEGARPYIARTLTNGNFHGTLMAAALSDAALCAGSLAEHQEAEARVETLVNSIPEPNPLLNVYLIFAAAAVDRPDLARRLLAARTAEPPQGSLADVADALEDGLADPAAFARERDRLRQELLGFYWGGEAREELLDKLAAVAAYPG